MSQPAYSLDFLERDHSRHWPAQGEWTYDDYLCLPEDGRRYEVLEGVLYVTPAPAFGHQFSVSKLGYHLLDFVLKADLGVVLVAPFDIRLPNRLADPVEPDLVFFRKGNEPRDGDKYFEGRPDLVVEVLSPGTRRVDEKTKLSIYQRAGIPEYWLVDPATRMVLIYRWSPDTGRYLEWVRADENGEVGSTVLAGLRLKVSEIFPPRA